jgi:hypothetical protein
LASGGQGGYGYLMRLREPRFKGIIDMMKRRVEPGFRALATAGGCRSRRVSQGA